MEKTKTFIYRALAYLTAMALIANIGFFEAKFVKSFNNTISLTAEAWGVSTYAVLDDNGNLSIRNRNVMMSGGNLIEENGGTYDLKSVYSLPNDCGISNLLTVDNEWSSLSGNTSPVKTVTVDDEISPTNISGLFQDFTKLNTANLTNVDTTNTDNMSNVFEGCSALDTLTLGERFGNSEQTFSTLGLDKIITGWTKQSESHVTDYFSSNIRLGVKDTYSAVTYCYATVLGGYLRIYQRKYVQSDNGTIYSWRSGSSTSGYTTCEGGRPPKDASGNIRKNWSSFGTDSIKVVEVVDNVKPLSLDNWFRECRNLYLKDLNIDNLNTSDAVSMAYMFYDCNKPTEYDLRHFNTSKVKDMSYMFAKCWKLQTVDLSSFDTSNVTNMKSMFDMTTTTGAANNLKTIYTSDSFVTDQVTSSTNMFYLCTHLVGGSLTTYDSTKVDKEYARIDGKNNGLPGYFTEKDTAPYDLLEEEKESDEEITTIDFDFSGIDDTNLEWLPISEHEDMMPYPNEDYQIEFMANEGYKLPDTIEVIIDGIVYNVATSGENAESEPTFANGILTIPAELLTEETKSLVIIISVIPVDEQTEEEKPTDEEKTDEPSEEQNPTEEAEDKKDDTAEDTTPKDEETETDKSDDTSKDNTTSGGEADKETDTDEPTEEIKQTFDIDITEIENADIKGKDGKALSAENLLDEDGNAILVITADKDHAIPQSFNITIDGKEYTIDTTKAEQADGIVWELDTGTLTIPKDLLNGENVEIGVKLQAIVKEDEDEEKTDKPDEDKNPDNSGDDKDDTDNKNDENTSGGTEEEKPKDDTTEGGNTDTDTENGGNADTENGGTTDNDGNTENGEQKPSDDVTDNGDNDTTDTPITTPETDGDKKDDTDNEDSEGNDNNEGNTTVPPADTEESTQPPSEENGEGEAPSDNQDKVDGSDSSDNSSSTDNDVSTDTESGNNAPATDGNTSSESTDSKGESSDSESSSSSNDSSSAESNSSAPTTSTNTTTDSVTAPTTSTTTSSDSSSSGSTGSSSDGGASSGNGGNNSNNNTNSSTTTSTNTTTKKKTETSGTTGGDSNADSN